MGATIETYEKEFNGKQQAINERDHQVTYLTSELDELMARAVEIDADEAKLNS